ncbi:hypothetical protein V5O48_001336 [Marasmius crinis-equi]|uniref:BHLH domain-containing protein n=1 Tax=Marasmius crinis-equi TaxID=585013 RepID=A0ABR3FZ82_9AGAR
MEIGHQQSQSQLQHSPALSQEDHSQLSQGNYFYSSDQEQHAGFYNVASPMGSPMQPYQVVSHDNPSRHLSEMQQSGMHFQSMPNAMMYQQGPVYPTSPPHVSLPISHSPPPPSPELYDPISPPISGSDTSADGIYNSSGANSPSSPRANSLVHRNVRHYNPTPSPTSSSGRRSRGRSNNDSDEDEMGAAYAADLAHNRKEATRRQRIEAEQRRRDELRDGYAKLKDVLPVSNQKSSKVSLLERATNYITQLEAQNQELQNRLNFLEQEMQRLRALNEKISLPSRDSPPPKFDPDARPLSPPPDVPMPNHSHPNISNRPISEGSSPSNSENGY